MLYPPAEAHSGPSQASQMECFAKIVEVFKLALLTIFKKLHHRYLPCASEKLGADFVQA